MRLLKSADSTKGIVSAGHRPLLVLGAERLAPSGVQLGQTAELVCRHTEAAEAPLSTPVIVECASKSPLVEVRPEAIAEVELCERAFPEQKIAQAPLASGANQQVDLGCRI